MKKIVGYCLILFLILGLGCLPAQKGRMDMPTEADVQPPRFAFSGELDEKIGFLNKLLEGEYLSEDDKRVATNLLNAYQELQKLSSLRPKEAQYLNIIQELFLCLSAMDKRYFAEKKVHEGDHSKTIGLFSQKRNEILDCYISGDFRAVIDLCVELKTMFGPEALTPDIGLLFALSLARKGMLNEAISIGEGIAKELELAPDIVQLRIGIAEWYLQQGEQEKAILMYEKIADTLDEMEIDIQFLSRKIAAAENSRPDMGSTTEQVRPRLTEDEVPVDQLIEEIDKLLEENKFSDAREMLLIKEQNIHSASEAEIINQALKRLELAEEDYLEEKISMISTKRDMEQARKLLEEERFEEVITRLEAIKPEDEDSREINELKQFAIEKLINRQRNKAAKIYLTAKETRDPERKKESLREALQILKDLVERYPLSNLNQRLKSHIKIVEEEIAKLER